MRRTQRRAALWVALCGSLLAAAVLVPAWVVADSEQVNFTATLYSDVIRFEADGAASLRVQVFDLAENELWSSGLVLGGFADWDRTNTRGERLANGYYLYLAQGWDAGDRLILNKAGKVVLLPGNQVELRAAPVIGAIVGSGDDLVMSPMLHTIADDLQVNGTITATEAGSASGSLAVQAGPTGSRSKFTLTAYAPGASGDFASFIMRTDNQDAVFSVKDVSADTWHSAFDFEYLNALFDFKGNEVNNIGQLGIGTTSPSQELDVVGDIELNGVLYMGANRFLHNYGIDNTFLGEGAGNFAMSGDDNTGVGHESLSSNTIGDFNTGVGYNSLTSNITGCENTAVGWYALGDNTTGDGNTAVGDEALSYSITGDENVALGNYAGVNLDSGSYNVYIANRGASSESNTIRIGNSTDHSAAYFAGVRGVSVSGGEYVVIDSNGQLGSTAATGGSGYWAASGSDIYNTNSGRVGIGTSSPWSPLHVTDSAGTAFFEASITNEGNSDWAGLLISGDGDAWTHSLITLSDQGSPFHSWILAHKKDPSHYLLFAYNVEGVGEDQIMVLTPDGKVGIGTSSPDTPLDVVGNVRVRNAAGTATVVELGEGLDYAEGFDVSDNTGVSPGAVLVIDADNPGLLAVSRKPYDRKVAGIVAGANALGSGVRLGSDQFDHDVALAGRVYCNVDTTYGAIEAGDLLTTSPTPGHAMKVIDYAKAQGAILGKAMECLEAGKTGQILVLVTLQ